MSTIYRKLVTRQGEELNAKAAVGGKIVFTRFQLGNGSYTLTETDDELKAMTAIKSVKNEYDISKAASQSENTVLVTMNAVNTAVTVSYSITELGIFARTEENTTDVLYSICVFSNADTMPAYTGSDPYTITYRDSIVIGNASEVKVKPDGNGLALQKDLEAVESPEFDTTEQAGISGFQDFLTLMTSGKSIYKFLGNFKKAAGYLLHKENVVANFNSESDTDVLAASQGNILYSYAKDDDARLNELYTGVDLTVKFALEIAKYSNAWQWIKARESAGNYVGIHVADYIPVTLTNGEKYKAEIMGIDTYKGYGSTEVGHHIDWCFRELWTTNHVFNRTNYNNGLSTESVPFLVSDLYAYLNSLQMAVPNGTGVNPTTTTVDYRSDGVYYKLPSELKAVIVNKNTLMGCRYSSSGLLTDDNGWDWRTIGPLWIPTEAEVTGMCVWSTKAWSTGGSVQYPLLRNCMRRAKRKLDGSRCYWWVLSPRSGYSSDVGFVNGDGHVGSGYATITAITLLVCFRT